MTAEVRPVVVPPRQFAIYDRRGTLIAATTAETAEQAMREAAAIYGDDCFLQPLDRGDRR